ncbi:MAG: thiol peroxidase [Acidobacteria bacterium]|nr:thiol peroxidase [Acidobacteriota bacterium]MXW38405.1 thiol peroxidase [Acidobacteriota bacterium]MYA46489.1 thiol peroxidase [Acidobacteriota bacterium]MYB33332.1 thiol peroxidase [Acidobacteriota bacterium]MYH22994.1 thiol peroxidase [Acidobacteriota bacterium]
MATVTLGGTPFAISGDLPEAGAAAPDFTLTGGDLGDISLGDYAGQRLILNIFPSVDTPVCAASVRRFNEEAAALEGVSVLCVSRDLPFAHGRFCAAENIEAVSCASEMRDGSFGDAYGVRITEGPLNGLLARAVVVVDGDGRVRHSQLVPEIKEEPDYDAALSACS